MIFKSLFSMLTPERLSLQKLGYCPVCSHRTLFLVIGKLELIRNNATCIRCGSIARHRGLAYCVLQEFSGRGIRTLSHFRSFPEIQVLNTSSASPVARALGNAPNIFNTEYFDNCTSGQVRNGVMCQNLECLSFENKSLDLVISEDVFEHVQDVRRGFTEIHRVLKPGGVHVFTIPFFFSQKTRDLFKKEGNEYVPAVLPVEYHGDGVRGKIPAYHHLGYDMFDLLADLGFMTTVHFSEFHEYLKNATYNCFTFISRR